MFKLLYLIKASSGLPILLALLKTECRLLRILGGLCQLSVSSCLLSVQAVVGGVVRVQAISQLPDFWAIGILPGSTPSTA